MAGLLDGKVFAGARVRRIRQEHRLTQTEMAERVGVSLSYLNLIERNQRPLTASVLLRLANAFDIELRSLTEAEHGVSEQGLAEIFGDPALAELAVSRGEIQDLIANAPNAARAIETLYGLVRDRARRDEGAGPQATLGTGMEAAVERVRDLLAARSNHFPEIETLAERMFEEIAPQPGQFQALLAARLQERHRIRVRVLPGSVMGPLARSFDAHRRSLNLSELLEPPSRLFQMAFQLGTIEAKAAIDQVVASADLADPATLRLFRTMLLNYFAGALVMPYGRFLKAAEDLAYDIELIGQRFEASFEQICHRLTTLHRSKSRGISFFMIRVDPAGNVSKRFSAAGFPFSRFGGTCPLWNVHKAFEAPGRILTQIVELPEGERYFSIARTVRRAVSAWGRPEAVFAIGLACDVRSAERLAYSRGIDLRNATPMPIGVNCRLCPRPDCPQRAAPPIGKEMRDSEVAKPFSPYGFVA